MKRLVIIDGTLEALKWLSLVFMTGDHVNKYLFNGAIDFLYFAGRDALSLVHNCHRSISLSTPGFFNGHPRFPYIGGPQLLKGFRRVLVDTH